MQIYDPYTMIVFDVYTRLHGMIFVAVLFQFPSQVLLVLVAAYQFALFL